jgi:hypothetical protein
MNEQEKQQVVAEIETLDTIFNTIPETDKTTPETRAWLDDHFKIIGVGF